jgi:hypothetical protein
MKYVDLDPVSGAVNWDRYFAYLRTAEAQFPVAVRSYAADWEHYSLDGNNSLHDAWLSGITFQNCQDRRDLILEFLGPRHDRRHVLRYEQVQAYVLDVHVEYRYGDRDVLAHEFRIENSCVTHEILFSNRGRIVVTASNVIPEVGVPL